MPQEAYDPKAIEPKWQQVWLEQKLFATEDPPTKKKMYVLDMFPYPSGDGLHVGHGKIYTASDIVSRYLRMKGFSVLHPTGWDGFGLPTENSALKFKVHPADLTQKNIDRFRGQMQRLGLSYDWDREVNTTDPNYYKWTQWIFLQLFKMGLAYEATVPINWCPKDKTGLANEEVVDGKCERCGTPVEQRPIRQWMLKITRYADRLLQGLDGLDWPDFIVELQKNWIGRSEGAEITFMVNRQSAVVPAAVAEKPLSCTVYTTRPDTIYGATYLVLAPEHPLVQVVTTPDQQPAVQAYVEASQQKTTLERTDLTKEKTGVFTGGYAINPANNESLPIWVADYVLLTYGSGAIMAVPGHDERDFAFAKKYNLPIKQVIEPVTAAGVVTLPYTGDGVLVASGPHDGQSVTEAQARIVGRLQQQGYAKKAVHFKLRDWVFSRQRYWGEPIPLIHCEKCGIVPVPEKDLPVLLPQLEHYEPTGTGESPLAAAEEWIKVKCPTCPNIARRETNTMPQWAGSSWYFWRFADPHNTEELGHKEKMKAWLPVDVYMGGAEHAVLHLLYARFWTKALYDQGLVPFDEPFKRLRSVGLVMGEDGQKMSKSRGNVINPDDIIARYGADTLRLYEMFMGPFDQSVAWNTASIAGVHRFLKRVWKKVGDNTSSTAAPNPELEQKLQATIKRVSESIEQFKFNTGVAALMEYLNALDKVAAVDQPTLERFLVLLTPFAPHLTEELWQRLGHTASITQETWPAFSMVAAQQSIVNIPVQVNGKVRGVVAVPIGADQVSVEQAAAALENVQRHLQEGTVARTVFVPDRLLNYVVQSTS
jgi:leucyl-tRNA synthetase